MNGTTEAHKEILEYDMVVLGAGIAGTIAALCLSRAGVKTLCVEKKVHPRFVIGESTTPQTSMDAKKLGKTYGIPELQHFSRYAGMRHLGIVTYPKELFWFGYHRDGEALREENETISVTTIPPLGPECHMLRSDADKFLASLFPKYGVDYMDNTSVAEFTTSKDADFVDMQLHSHTEPQHDTNVRCKFVVDCTGHNCFLSRKYNLHHHDAQLQHRSRTIYCHFQIPDGWDLDKLCGGRSTHIHTKRDNATMHHMFEGGWFWIIPFENNTVSVGLVLDLDMYPLDHSITAEEEWNRIINRFPTVKAHLGPLIPVRTFLRSGRIQITSSTILGDRFILAPHAASFIDPLYSTGIALTLRFVRRFVSRAQEILAVKRSPEIPHPNAHIRKILQPMEESFNKEIDTIDKIVGGSFDALHHPAIFRQYWRLWILGAAATLIMGKDDPNLPLFYSWNDHYVKCLTEAFTTVREYAQKIRKANVNRVDRYSDMTSDETESLEVAVNIKQIADHAVGQFHKQLAFPLFPMVPVQTPNKPCVFANAAASEYLMEFIIGAKRPRPLSVFIYFTEYFVVNVHYYLGKLLGSRYSFGEALVRYYQPHVRPNKFFMWVSSKLKK